MNYITIQIPINLIRDVETKGIMQFMLLKKLFKLNIYI